MPYPISFRTGTSDDDSESDEPDRLEPGLSVEGRLTCDLFRRGYLRRERQCSANF